MNNKRMLALLLLVPFTVLTIYAVMQVGYIGIFDYHRHSPAGWQVISDLVIALILVMAWMINDAKKTNRKILPWLVLTCFLGSIGPLLYLLCSENVQQKVIN